MKKALFTIVLFLFGMTVFAQSLDMSFYTEEYNRSDATVYDLLDILEAVRRENRRGIGDFYHNALNVLILKLPIFASAREKLAVQDIVRIILNGLAFEKHIAAAPNVWLMIQRYDVIHQQNDGFLMNMALVTMGEIGAKNYAPNIVTLLENFNVDQTPDLQTRRKIQLAVSGCIKALEALKEPIGVKPVFFASIGWYDPDIRAQAAAAFPNIMEDPGEIISDIIKSPSNGPDVKITALQIMLNTRAQNISKARVAAVALETSYTFITPVREEQRVLRDMRLIAVETIRKMGVADEMVYSYLDRAYREAYNTSTTDFETITLIIAALSAIRTVEAVDILTENLRKLHARRRSGPWGITEREIMQKLIPAIAVTGTDSQLTMQLLSTIQRSTMYTSVEQSWAASALKALVK